MEYRNPFIKPDVFGGLAVALCRLFRDSYGNGALLAWEVPGPGYTFGKTVGELHYTNVYYKRHEFKQFADASDEPGWYASPNNKKDLLLDYCAALHSRQFLNRSKSALADCLAFRYDKRGMVEHSLETNVQDPSGARSNHADVVIADALSWKMAKTFGQPEAKKIEEAVPVLSLQWRRNLAEQKTRDELAWA